MKVGSINFYSLNNVNMPGATSSNKAEEHTGSDSSMTKAPIDAFNHYALSFESNHHNKSRPKLFEINLNHLEIKGLICPCCGKTMVPSREISRVFSEYNLITDKSQETIKNIRNNFSPETDFIKSFSNEDLDNMSAKELISKLQQKSDQKTNFAKFFNENYLMKISGKEKETARGLVNALKQDTITNTEFYKIFNENCFPSKSGKELITILQPYEKTMHDTEKLVFQSCKQLALVNQNASLNELISSLQHNCIDVLAKHQTEILEEIKTLCNKLPKEEAKKLHALIKASEDKIFENDPSKSFKRKTFIEKLAAKMEKFPETSICSEIYNKTLKINTSSNDFNAFIVKYARRNSTETCRRLVTPSMSTIEHIHAHCDFDDLEKADDMANLILECKECNNEKTNLPLIEQIKRHQEMKINVQKYFDSFIEKFSNGEIDKKYTAEMLESAAETLAKESKGLIKIDLSKLLNAIK